MLVSDASQVIAQFLETLSDFTNFKTHTHTHTDTECCPSLLMFTVYGVGSQLRTRCCKHLVVPDVPPRIQYFSGPSGTAESPHRKNDDQCPVERQSNLRGDGFADVCWSNPLCLLVKKNQCSMVEAALSTSNHFQLC